LGGVGLGRYLESGETSHGEHATQTEGLGADHAAAEPAHTEHKVVVPSVATSQTIVVGQGHPDQVAPPKFEVQDSAVNQKGRAGLFFSIYYCMTGVHAMHILGGMVVLTWLIVKAADGQFHKKYFGPVDNVGLYWHLVDFIWIYLFPLLYLIG